MNNDNPHVEREKSVNSKLAMYKEHKQKLETYMHDLKTKLYDGHITQQAYNNLVAKYKLESKLKEYSEKIAELEKSFVDTKKQKVLFTVRKDVMIAAAILVFIVIISLVYMNIQLNLAPYVVYDPGSKMAKIEVNEFVPLSTIMSTTIGNETKYYPISNLITAGPKNGTYDNEQTLGYFIETLDVDFSEFNITEGEVVLTKFMLNESEILSFNNLIKFSEEPTEIEIDATMYEITLDKTEYALGESVEINVVPETANTSVVVIDENENMQVVEELSYVANETGNFEVNALICVADECINFKIACLICNIT